MKKTDVQCSACGAAYQRIELTSTRGAVGEFRCKTCGNSLEALDGLHEVAYRLVVAPERLKARRTPPAG